MATTSWGEVLGTVASQLVFLEAGEQQSTQQPSADSDDASVGALNSIGAGSAAPGTGGPPLAGPEAVPASQSGTSSIRPAPSDGTDGDVVDLRGRLHHGGPAASTQQLLLRNAEEVSVPSMFLLGSQQAAEAQQQQCLEQQLGPAAISSRGCSKLCPARVCLMLVRQAAGPRSHATAECEFLLPDVLEVMERTVVVTSSHLPGLVLLYGISAGSIFSRRRLALEPSPALPLLGFGLLLHAVQQPTGEPYAAQQGDVRVQEYLMRNDASQGAVVRLSLEGSGCQASNAVPAADNAQCFMGHYERPSTDAYCDSFCGSDPALSNGLFSMKICPGTPPPSEVPQDAAGNVTFSVLLMDLDEANCTSTVEAAILAAIEDAAGTNTTTSVSFKPYRNGDDGKPEGIAVLATTTLWSAEQAEEHREAFSRQLQQSSRLCGMLPGHECSSLRLLSLNGVCMEACSESNWLRGDDVQPSALSWCEVPDQASGYHHIIHYVRWYEEWWEEDDSCWNCQELVAPQREAAAEVQVAWRGNFAAGDVFAGPQDLNLVDLDQQSIELDAIEDDEPAIMYILTTACGCKYGYLLRCEVLSKMEWDWPCLPEPQGGCEGRSSPAGQGWRNGFGHLIPTFPVTLYNQGDSTSAFDFGAIISVPTDCMCHDISQSGTSGVSFSAPPGATVTLYKDFGCQPSMAFLAENNAQCFNGNHELPSTDSTCDSFSASSLQAASLNDKLHSIMICSVTLYNLCNATSAVDIDATLTIPADCSCFDVTQSGVNGISYNADPTLVTLFQGSGCQASNAVPAADNAQCFMGHYERPSTDAYCDSFCASTPALSNGLFSLKICPGTVTCPNPTALPDRSLPDIISDLPEISVNIETSITLSNRMCGITEAAVAPRSGALAGDMSVTPGLGITFDTGSAMVALELHASLAPGSYMGTLEVDFTATYSACVAKHYRQLVVTQAIETDDNIQAALTAASYSNGTVILTFGVDITPAESMDSTFRALFQMKQHIDPFRQQLAWDPTQMPCHFEEVTCHNDTGAMISFSVASKGLSGRLPDNSSIWESFSEVESLDFSGNSLTGNLPTSLATLHRLTSLHFGSNQLSGILPRAFLALPGSAVINLSDNQGMCGGVPRPLANKLSLSRNVNSFATPCLNSPVSFSLAGANFVVLKLGSQDLYTAAPAPVGLEYFDATDYVYTQGTAPSLGILLLNDVALPSAGTFTLADLLLGHVTYSRGSSATSGTDVFDIERTAGSTGVAQG
eukprot:jgi/Astpho2/1198/fgenesh1_pg.00022_%23_8_t